MKIKNLLRTLAVAIVATVSLSAAAATFTVDNITYETNGTNVTITNVRSSVTSLTIPATVTNNGTTYTVTAIASSTFNNCTSLTSLTIEDSDEPLSVGHGYWQLENTTYAPLFYSCPLETVYLGRDLTYTDTYSDRTATGYNYAPFKWNNNIKTVTIGAQVTTLGNYLFENDTNIERIYDLRETAQTLDTSRRYANRPTAFKGINSSAWLIVPFGASSNYSSWNFSNVAELGTLAQIVADGTDGTNYCVADEVNVAYTLNTNSSIWVKDDNNGADQEAGATGDQIDYVKNAGLSDSQDQSTWAKISVSKNDVEDLTDALLPAQDMIVKLDSKDDHTFTQQVAFTVPTTTSGSTKVYNPNTYVVPNFNGQNVQGGQNGKDFYFYTPRQQEVANVVWAVYDQATDSFVVPTQTGSSNQGNLSGSFSYTTDYYTPSTAFADGAVYALIGVINYVDGKATLQLLNATLAHDDIYTAVDDVDTAKEVASKTYYNVAGVKSDEPFKGVNIVVTTYTDGTTSTAKVLQ